MKNSIYVIALSILTLFSCSVDEINEDAALLDQIHEEELNARFPMDREVCQRYKLVDNGLGIGVLDIAFVGTNVHVTYKVDKQYSLIAADLAWLDEVGEQFPLNSNNGPDVDNFEHKKTSSVFGSDLTIIVPQEYFSSEYYFAAHALIVDIKSNKKSQAWSTGFEFNGDANATYSYINTRNCGL